MPKLDTKSKRKQTPENPPLQEGKEATTARQKAATPPRGGRKSLASGEDPIFEERIEYVAGLIAKCCQRGEIVRICKRKYGSSPRSSDRYIAEVRRRWRVEHDSSTLPEKRDLLIQRLMAIARGAEARNTNGENGPPRPNPDLWLMRQIAIDIAKIEGVYESETAAADAMLDQILDELNAQRAAEKDKSTEETTH